MSKPVAWINQHNLEFIAKDGVGNAWREPYFNGDIPLYTLRELADEEIVLVWNSFERTDNIPFIDFARAVLKCASEK